MKIEPRQVDAFLKKPDPRIRGVLVYGQDDGLVAERVHAGSGIFGLYPATDPKSLEFFAEWRKKNGR